MLGKELLEKIGLDSNPATEKGRSLRFHNTDLHPVTPLKKYVCSRGRLPTFISWMPTIPADFAQNAWICTRGKVELESPILLPPGLTTDHFENPSTELSASKGKTVYFPYLE